ncbi:hypothetical protein PtB15_18B81 [Puccinia triticina]|nr:hypothetical protein PtB15_18B81 [Puccinia triticina]
MASRSRAKVKEANLKIEAELASAAASGATPLFVDFLEFDLAKMAAGKRPWRIVEAWMWQWGASSY